MKKVAFWSILFLAFFLRFFQLGSIPRGFYCDEAANGYDAYCLIKTGKSLFGKPFPLFFDHYHEDLVEPLYVYGLIPFIAMGGLTPGMVRAEAAVLGTLTMLFFFLWLRKRYGDEVAFMGSLFLAISPWHVAFSRVAFRAIWAPFLMVLFLYLWEKRAHPLILGGVFGLIGWSYSPIRLFLPFFFLWWFLKEKPLRWMPWRRWLPGGMLSFLLLIPIFWISFKAKDFRRFQELHVLTRPEPAAAWLHQYLAHLSPDFLFISGDPNGRHGYPLRGLINPFVGLLALVGFFLSKEVRSFGWLVLAGIFPSSLLATGVPNGLRALFVLPFPMVMAALAWKNLHKKRPGLSKVWVGLLALWGFGLWGEYQITQPFRYAGYNSEGVWIPNWWEEGFQEALNRGESLKTPDKPIIISLSIDQSYLLVLFFKAYPPEKFQKEQSIEEYHFVHPEVLERYLTQKIPGVYILSPWEGRAYPGVWVRHPDGKPAYKILIW